MKDEKGNLVIDNIKNMFENINEELGYNIDFTLCSIQENFVIKEEVKIMQYNFCYKGIYKGIINNDRFVCKDNNNQYFYWVDIEQLNCYKVYPESTTKLIKSKKLEHIIEKND